MDVRMKLLTFPAQPQTERDEGTIAMLEAMIASVRSGEVSHVGLAACHTDGSISTGYTSGKLPHLLGAVAYLQHRINRLMEEQ